MEARFLMRTKYYHKPGTWFKRGLEFLVAAFFLYWISSVERDGPYAWIKYALFAILSVYIFVRPVDELAVNSRTLFYIQKSVISYFTRVEEFDLSQIRSIGCGGLYDTDTEFLGKARPVSNRLEIIFKDNSSRTLDIKIYKGELKWIVKNTLKLLKQTGV